MLNEGTDYLYYPRAYHSGGAVTGLTNSEVAVVATRRYLFIVPERSTSLGPLWITVKTTRFNQAGEQLTVQQVIERAIAQSNTIEALEDGLRELLPPDQVTPLDGIKSLSVWTKFMRQVRFKRVDRRATQVLALRGKANHEKFKTFYAAELR
jgi:hypothetical protein